MMLILSDSSDFLAIKLAISIYQFSFLLGCTCLVTAGLSYGWFCCISCSDQCKAFWLVLITYSIMVQQFEMGIMLQLDCLWSCCKLKLCFTFSRLFIWLGAMVVTTTCLWTIANILHTTSYSGEFNELWERHVLLGHPSRTFLQMTC